MVKIFSFIIRACLLFMGLFVANLNGQAQQAVSAKERDEMICQVIRISSGIHTMRCGFVQEKRLSLLKENMVSKGKMYFKSPDMLRWEYESPYTYAFVLNKQKVLIKSAGKKDVIDVKSSHLFTEIARIMMGSVTGSCLMGNADFRVEMFKEKMMWIARLTPKSSRIKRMFKNVTLYINSQDKMIERIVIKEKTGDETRIALNKIQLNQPLHEKVFAID